MISRKATTANMHANPFRATPILPGAILTGRTKPAE